MKKMTIALVAVVSIMLATTAGLWAQDNDTLEKIKRSGKFTVGVVPALPFSYFDDYGTVIGYSTYYSHLIAESIKKELNMPGLTVEYIEVNAGNRIPKLVTGDYDIECGSTTNNIARQSEVAFSNTIFVVGTRLLTHKESGINDIPDLQGRKVAVTKGTTTESLINLINSAEKLNIEIISTNEFREAFLKLESGQVDAFFLDDAILAGERAGAVNPSDWVIVGPSQSYETYGCMIRKDDPRFKKLVDDAVALAQTSGEAEKAFNRWFKSPVPPTGTNLNFDMPDVMRNLFRAPNDEPYQ
ncbi:glutamate/aspartate ABC transporter substrate-binding protein [Deltaproteobacteria bacterium Smac51]|nr:glutamate/aspartate ABC transporter substrate-binding protein [Deltaproteobacteria bacterium Smac51]